jgi:hypothetical protein
MATSQTCCYLPGEMLNSAAEYADRAQIQIQRIPLRYFSGFLYVSKALYSIEMHPTPNCTVPLSIVTASSSSSLVAAAAAARSAYFESLLDGLSLLLPSFPLPSFLPYFEIVLLLLPFVHDATAVQFVVKLGGKVRN